MLSLSFQEFFLRVIPEEFLFIFAVYAFSKTMINIKKYFMASGLLVVIAYLIRLLPIQYGVHTIIGIVAMIAISTNINRINIIKAIQASIGVIIIEFLCEGINILIIQYVLKKDINYVFSNPNEKILYGIPSMSIFACVVILYYWRALKRNELKDV